MKKIFFALALISMGFLFISAAHAVTISPTLPGSANSGCTPGATSGCNPAAFVNNFYSFALIIGGILAFGAVVYGGVKYITAAGNPSGQKEGKDWIEAALLGLLLLAGAYLILYTINPQLTTLALPNLQPVSTNTGGAGGSY